MSKPTIEDTREKVIFVLANVLWQGKSLEEISKMSLGNADAAVDEILALIAQAEQAARIDERANFIVNDANGKNAVWIAKIKNAAQHEHDFNFDSKVCKCGVNQNFMIDAQDDIKDLSTTTPKEGSKNV